MSKHLSHSSDSIAWCRGQWLQNSCAYCRSLFVAAALCHYVATGSSSITDDEQLLRSDGSWHRGQRKQIDFATSCYFTHEASLPYGCQYSRSKSIEWKMDQQRTLQVLALMDLHVSAGGSNWRASEHWSADTDPCFDSWYGVTCDEHGYVISLELSDNKLVGTLPASLSNLRSLIRLDLSTSATNFHGHPNRYANRLQGAMPSLAAATRLEEIDVSGNQISALPADLWKNSRSLRVLCASHNQLTTLPRELRRFTALHTLELAHNLISDSFPSTDFGLLSNLRFVQLEYNQLEGRVTDDIRGMRLARAFDVSHNPSLAGEIPTEIITEWKNMDWLSVLNTSVSGYISSLCLDVPHCYKYMYDTHQDLTWAVAADIPDIVDLTLELAKSMM